MGKKQNQRFQLSLEPEVALPGASTKKRPEMTRRLLGSSAIIGQQSGAADITVALDVEGFIRRLLLFDTYVLYSVRLKEVPELVRHFGYEGTLTLLSSGALEIRCECAQFVEGQFSTPPCPPLTFQFHIIEAHNRDQYLIDNLSEVNRTPGLDARQLMELRGAVTRAVRQPDNREMFSSAVAPAFEADVLHNTALLKAAVRFILSKEKGITGFDDFALRFHKVGDDRYETETDLPKKLNFGFEDIHNVVKAALLGVSGVNQRLGEMRAHTALSGFTDEELPLFRTKLDSLAAALGGERQERRFHRIIEVAGLRDVRDGSRIDIEKLLEVRSQPEALEFRSWLADSDRLSDSEIHQRVASFNAKLGLAAQTKAGKLLRFLVTTVAGIVPPIGWTLGLLDQFAWDKFADRSGVAAFIHELYPSIFHAPQR